MIATKGLVVVIYPGLRQPKKSCESVTSGPPSLKIALKWLRSRHFKPMWHCPYIVRRVLEKGAYKLEDYEGNKLVKPRNGLYLKKYYA
jgi:hypothetical protein